MITGEWWLDVYQWTMASPWVILLLAVVQVWTISAVGSDIAENCAAEPPCECYEKTEFDKENPGGENIKIVDCSNKMFSAVPFFRQLENTTFDRVLLQNNRIAVVPSHAFLGLSVSLIDLSGNKIDTIEEDAFSGLERKLTTLLLRSNKLNSWPYASISVLERLETLNILTNTEIRELPADSFQGLLSLTTVDIGNCPEGFTIDPDAFKPVKDTLKKLILHHCSLTEVPEALTVLSKLENLRLPLNLFSKLEPHNFKGLESLKTLDLTGNENLTLSDSFNDDSFLEVGGTLELLDLTRIKFPSVPEIFKPLKQLEALYLSDNNLSSIASGIFAPLSKLKSLYLGGNPLDFNPGTFEGLSNNLTFLGIRNQNLTRLPNAEMTSLRCLKTVSASGNNFRVLDGDFTVGISATSYHLGNSSIVDILPSAFLGKLTQVSLNLEKNFLRNLDFVKDPCYFWKIDVSDNPIECDCLTYRLSKYPHLLLRGTCAAPETLKDMQIGSSEFDNVMYWQCVDHFFEDTKLCSQWWLLNEGFRLQQSAPFLSLSLMVCILTIL